MTTGKVPVGVALRVMPRRVIALRVIEAMVALAAADGCLRFLEWWHRGAL